jgi:divalent anion:Na+ symporter, DASS family
MKDTRKIVGAICGIVLGVLVALIPPPAGLTPHTMQAIGILVWGLAYFSFHVIAEYIIALLMCVMWAGFKIVPFGVAFASFQGTTWWLVVGVLGIGIAVKKSGLLGRTALLAMKLFPPTFKGQVLSMLAVGTVVAPLMPSTSVKIAIAGPISVGIAEYLGFTKKSDGLVGLFMAMYIGFSVNGSLFLSSSFLSYMMIGVLPANVQAEFTWLKWFLMMIPYGIVLLIGSYFAVTRLYSSAGEKTVNKDFITEKIAALGPMSRDEKVTLCILLIALCFWVTESVHHISATLVALVAMSALVIFNVFGRKEFQNDLGWGLLVMLGGLLNIGYVMHAVNVDKWIGNVLSPYLGQIVSQPYLFVAVLAIIIYLARFIIDFAAGITIFTVVLVPIAAQAGISPWVVGMIAYTSCCIWTLYYQNANFLIAFSAVGGEDVVPYSKTVRMSLAYMVISLLGLLASVPYWQHFGLIP